VANVAQVMFYNTTSKEITYGNTISVAGNINASQFNFANGVNIFDTITGVTSINSSVATGLYSDESGDFSYGALSYDYAVNGVTAGGFTISYSAPLVHGNVDINVGNVTATGTANVANLTTTGNITAGNVSAVNFVGTIQAQVGSSFAYATDAYGSLFNTGGVPLPADTNSNAIVAGYTIVGNSGAVTLTVTSATFIPGTPNIVQVATTPTASSLAYPVTVYSADYSPAIPVSTITVGNATVSGNVIAPNYLFANGVNILSAVGAGSYGNANVASYLLHFDGDIEFTSSTAKIGNVDVITVGAHIQSPAYRFSNNVSIFDGITGTYSNTNVAAYLTSGVTTANLTATGNVVQNSAYYETYANVTNSGGNLTCNFNLGTIFYAALTANVTANFTNVNAIASTVTGATIIVDQGATAYRVANVQVNGVNQTVKWVGAAIGTGTASNTDIMSFSLIHLGGAAYRVLGQISNYG
jgi:hypothetical protein